MGGGDVLAGRGRGGGERSVGVRGGVGGVAERGGKVRELGGE